MANTPSKKNAIGAGSLVIFAFAVFLCFTDNPSSSEFPPSVVHHENSPTAGGNATFTLKLNGLTEDLDMVAAAEDMTRIAEHEIEARHSEGSILFDLVGDGHDLYGHKVVVDTLSLEFQMADLKRVEWSNFDGKKLLNLGRIVHEYPAGEKMVGEYCNANSDTSNLFCAVAVDH